MRALILAFVLALPLAACQGTIERPQNLSEHLLVTDYAYTEAVRTAGNLAEAGIITGDTAATTAEAIETASAALDAAEDAAAVSPSGNATVDAINRAIAASAGLIRIVKQHTGE